MMFRRFRPLLAAMLVIAAPVLCASQQIRVATGSGVSRLPEVRGPFFDITKYGARPDGPAVANQAAINDGIAAAAAAGGGTVVVPSGAFRTYTIRLKSRVGLHLASRDSTLRAAVQGASPGGDGGFYDAPEPNLFVGLQDHGHSHWANSLIYGVDVENVMISGPGLIDGSYINDRGETVNVLSGGDPREVTTRSDAGVPGGGNKAIALKNSKHITFFAKNEALLPRIAWHAGRPAGDWPLTAVMPFSSADLLRFDLLRRVVPADPLTCAQRGVGEM